MIEACTFATVCVISRGLLNAFDRSYFKKKENSFAGGIFFNAFYTLSLAVFTYLLLPCKTDRLIELFFLPGILFSALFSQLTALIFSYAFKNMSVKAVIVSSKLADIVIPMCMIPLCNTFSISSYIFACLSTSAFIPIFYAIKKQENKYNYLLVIQIILVLTAQACINSYFHMQQYSQSWIDFLEVFILILFWRTILCTVGVPLSWLYKHLQKEHIPSEPQEKNLVQQNHKLLIARSFIAFISQGAFFYSITRHHNDYLIWPILNTSPLIASFLAAKLLKEKFEKPEVISTIFIIAIFSTYLILKK